MLNEVKHLAEWPLLPRFFVNAQNDILGAFLLHSTRPRTLLC